MTTTNIIRTNDGALKQVSYNERTSTRWELRNDRDHHRTILQGAIKDRVVSLPGTYIVSQVNFDGSAVASIFNVDKVPQPQLEIKD